VLQLGAFQADEVSLYKALCFNFMLSYYYSINWIASPDRLYYSSLLGQHSRHLFTSC